MHREARIPRLYTALFHRHTANPLLTLAYDRAQESEADHIGLFLMTSVGHDANQAIALWKEMQAVAEGVPIVRRSCPIIPALPGGFVSWTTGGRCSRRQRGRLTMDE